MESRLKFLICGKSIENVSFRKYDICVKSVLADTFTQDIVLQSLFLTYPRLVRSSGGGARLGFFATQS